MDLALAGPSAPFEAGVEIEKAWYVVSLLLRVGRPARPAEIVARFRLVPASADFLEFLCRIPNSPLYLTEGGFVTVSQVAAAAAFREFVFGAVTQRVPRFTVRLAGLKRVWGVDDVFLRYTSRKRKQTGLLPKAKRRALLSHGNEELEAGELSCHILPITNTIECGFADEVQPKFLDAMSRNNLSVDVAVMDYTSGFFKESGPSTLPLLTYNASGSHAGEIICDKTTCIAVNKHSKLAISYHHQVSVLDAQIEGNASAPSTTNDVNQIAMTAQMVLHAEMNSMDSMFLQDCKIQKDKESVNHGQNAVGTRVNASGDDHGQGQAKKDFVKLVVSRDVFDILAPPASKTEAVATPPSFNVQKQKETLYNNPVDRIPPSALLQDASGTENNIRTKKKLAEVQEDSKFVLKKLRRSQNSKMPKKENRDVLPKNPENHVEFKKFPDFESFILEEEEGSGGYGTVYRARRKNDGKTFAVKCPHPNAHLYHINNELKMLERFGGRSFIIKYEGSFKSGNSECFVLEHVEHDRPEILKKEIEVSELQWYGYCMFRALSSLHKQGIVHRDVKPGNFLFSRKLNKGYLIDFNLALDLNHQQRAGGKSHANSHGSSEQISYQYRKPMPSAKATKSATGQNLEVFSKEPAMKASKGSGKIILSKYINKGASKCPDAFSDFECRNRYGIQVADGSGITSAKDVTSTRTPSADRLREPIPCCGRKELINLAQEVMQGPIKKSSTVPASQRKRIAAPLGKVERQLTFLTPMPLLSNGIAVSASVSLNYKEKKQRNEGPCVGTKGFRAPEVLFKSIHQSCKIDIWSAGVTLLYLMIGRAPFGGDPEQNMKEIAKLRGSEDLWEVSKLHNRESSFPMDLYDIHSLQAMKLRDWCEKNTKRPDFLDQIPSSLFDLVDKCLTVNPRCRISAEEALMHDFFSPCHDSLRKQRMLRQNVGLKTGSESQ
uniref:non-specific serine/threonine protein kinase n=1 Tax=Anthurium amnicola TaxID=1678845 RepID=A0A1D1XTZ3_9ARAE